MRSLTLLIPLLFLSSCTIDWNDEKKNIYPDKPVSEKARKAWISLKQEKNSINLYHDWVELAGWYYTDDRDPPLPTFSSWSCSEIEESLNILSGSTIWDIWGSMTYEWKRDCIKENTLRNIYVDMSGSTNVIVSWMTKYSNQKFIIDLYNRNEILIQ